MPCCRSLLGSTLGGIQSSTGIGATLVTDLNMSTGEMALAWIQTLNTQSTPGYYLGLCMDTDHAQWVMEHVIIETSKNIRDGILQLSNISKPERPKDEETMPEPPKLKALIWDPSSKQAKVPQDLHGLGS